MQLETISYQNKEIIYLDFTGCISQEQMIVLHNEVVKLLEKREGDDGLLLVNYTNAFAGHEYMKAIKESNPLYDQKLRKRAVIGVSKIQHSLVDQFNQITKKKVMVFDSKSEALEYLIK